MSIGSACRVLGFTCVLLSGVACEIDIAGSLTGTRPTRDATLLGPDPDSPPDSAEPSADLLRVLEVSAVTPFCCDGYERSFVARFDGNVNVAPATCHWEFGDGRSADGCRVRHRFSRPGEYTPSVTVLTMDGAVFDGTVDVTVRNMVPSGSDEDASDLADPDAPVVEYLVGPEGETSAGAYDVSWRLDGSALYSNVRLVSGCCQCTTSESQAVEADLDGIYTASVDIPADRSAWYFVEYSREDEGQIGPAIHTTVPLSQSSLSARPTVIWSYVGSRDVPEGLAAVLQTGLITDVAFFAGNRLTSDTLDKPETQEAIAVARQAGMGLILMRGLWQTQPGPDAELATLYNVDYYVHEINRLRDDAERIGAGRVGFDAEAYGPTPLTEYFRLTDGFTAANHESMVTAIDGAVARVGRVDFVLPAGSIRENHPYNALSWIARDRIADGTYYDNEQDIGWIPYRYDLAAMYVNVTKENPGWAAKPYYIPSEVFGRKAHIWTRTRGLLIWPREGRAEEVAEMFAAFSGACPTNPGAW